MLMVICFNKWVLDFSYLIVPSDKSEELDMITVSSLIRARSIK